MLIDKEGHEIILTDKPNGHVLVLGKSGSGKTYFLCRKMEEDVEVGRRVFVIDYSGSYSEAELMKSEFRFMQYIEVWNPFENEIIWKLKGANLGCVMTDSLLDALECDSYYQRKLMTEVIRGIVEQQERICIAAVMEALEYAIKTKKNDDERKNAEHLLNRLYPYRDIKMIWSKSETVVEHSAKQIIILNLSQYSRRCRKFLMELCSRFLWEETFAGKAWADVVVYDEFQHMNLGEGSAIDSVLREGRKFGVSAYLSSQFLGRKGEMARETLMQAGNMMFFAPTESEIKTIASWISLSDKNEWGSVLGELNLGEAVLKGNYRIDNGKVICVTAIVCRVKNDKEDKECF